MLQLQQTEKIDAWLRAPLDARPTDDRIEIRRAHPHEFERIYDLVDEAFGVRRPRDEFDWLYRRNATGIARCWMVIEKATGRLVSSEACYPWPFAWGEDWLDGMIVGDSVTTPDWQRKGLAHERAKMKDADPWSSRCLRVSGPNVLSQKAMKKFGRDDAIMGAIPAAALIFRSKPYLGRLGLPAPLAAVGGPPVDAVLGAWRGAALWRADRYPVREITRFDTSFDAVTEQHMRWPGFWSPHSSDFLNWRYLDHPTQDFQALSLEAEGEPIAYCVLRHREGAATLMEFVAPADQRRVSNALLSAAVRAARTNGASHLNFFAPARWRHWPLFWRAGFLSYTSRNYLSARGAGPACQKMENWQVLPGDRDYR